MITLTVTHLHGKPAEPGLQARFDETGGTVGRAEGCTLVLPDPDRNVSRLQARIVYRAGRWAVVDQGGNPTLHNGRTLVPGREVLLSAGDTLHIGAYALRVDDGSAAAQAKDPFAGFTDFGGIAPAPVAAAAAAPAPAPAAGGIPEDWDPFAPPPAAPAPSAAPRDLRMLIPPTAAPGVPPPSIDALFGLGPAAGADPLAGSPLAPPLAQPNMAGSDDPVQALRALPAAVPAAAADHVPELRRPFVAPPVALPAAAPAAAPRPAATVRSWDTGAAASATVIPAGEPAAPPPAAPADDDALRAALREGLGMPALPLPPLTPEFMRLVGELLHETARGTTQLLQARATMKREVKADATLIAPRENNPLKFSPTPEAALTHLLGPGLPGFQGPQRALREAFDDLRAHELGFLAGMRAAIDALLQRFDPAALESRLVPPGGLAGLLPGTRKAQLWQLFESEYRQIATEVAEDAQQLFGREFLQAYQAQVDALDRRA